MKKLFLIAALLLVPGYAHAADWYVATTGVSTNTGMSTSSPWDLQTALCGGPDTTVCRYLPTRAFGSSSVLVAGDDTIYVMDGTYQKLTADLFVSTGGEPNFIWQVGISGTLGHPITIRPYTAAPSGNIKIDGQTGIHSVAGAAAEVLYNRYGAYVTWEGSGNFEIFSSSTETRITTQPTDHPTDLYRPTVCMSFSGSTTGALVHNVVCHDVLNAGFRHNGQTVAGDNHFYGTVGFANGGKFTSGGLQPMGQTFYIENQAVAHPVTITRDLSGNNYNQCGQMYGSSNARIVGVSLIESTCLNKQWIAGALGSGVVDEIYWTNNSFYNVSCAMGYTGATNKGIFSATGNIFGAQYCQPTYWNNFTMTGNQFIKAAGNLVILAHGTGGITTANVNNNTYISGSGVPWFDAQTGTGYSTIAAWRAATGYDSLSTYSTAYPPATATVRLYSNAYDSTRYHLTIYNWPSSNTVNVDITSLGIPNGSTYSLCSVQNYYGDCATGIISGSTLAVNMQASAHPVYLPLGETGGAQFSNRFPLFGGFTLIVNTGAPPPSAPTISSIFPSSGDQGTTAPVTIVGSNFIIGATTITVAGTFGSVTGTSCSSTSTCTANFVISASAVSGAHGVSANTVNGTSNTVSFTVTVPPPVIPTLASVSPNSGQQNTSVPVTLSGTNYITGATTILVSGTGVTVNSTSCPTSVSCTATFDMASDAEASARSVTVVTANGTSNSQTFTVSATPTPPPSVSSVTPDAGLQAATTPVSIIGTSFVPGATTFTLSGTGSTVTGTNCVSSIGCTANFVVAVGVATGNKTVTVTTANGSSATALWTVRSPDAPPTLTGLSPNSAQRPTTVPVVITGTDLLVGTTTLNITGSGTTLTNEICSSSTVCTADIVVSSVATVGVHGLTVHTGNGTSNTLSFTVSASSTPAGSGSGGMVIRR